MNTSRNQLCWALGLLLAAVLAGCDLNGKDEPRFDLPNNNPTPIVEEDTITTVSSTVKITDHLGTPLESVLVTILSSEINGERSTLGENSTNSAGVVTFDELPENSQLLVRFSKDGYADQVKTLVTAPGGTLQSLAVALLPRELPQFFNAEESTELIGKDGAYLAVEADAFVDADGNPVSGEIAVNITPVDISTPGGLNAFPGDFRGLLDDDSETLIASFGSTEFVFEQDGQPLQLAPGMTATIDMPMYVDRYPNGELVQIGDRIPLWSLDESTAIWVLEGEGEVIAKPQSTTGLAMRATVSHFSWWNTDWYPQEAERKQISIEVIAVDTDGNLATALSDQYVTLYARVDTGLAQSTSALFTPFFETNSGDAFDGHWCFEASYVATQDDNSIELTSGEHCQNISGGEHIELSIVIDYELKVTNLLRPTATQNNDYGACEDNPRLGVQSLHPYTITLVSGSLPPGLSLQEDGRLTGTPTTPGTYSFQLDVESWLPDNTSDGYEIVLYTIEVSEELEFIAVEPPFVYIAYDYIINPFIKRGGLEPYEPIRLTPSGIVPVGMEFDDGEVSGTPARLFINGEPTDLYFAFTEATLEDANCAKVTDGYDHGVVWGPKINGTAPLAQANQPYSFTPSNSEGPIDYWELIPGEGDGLPAWASLNRDTGEITGTPGPDDVDQEHLVWVRAIGPVLNEDLLGDFRPEGPFSFTLNVFIAPPELLAFDSTLGATTGQAFSVTPTNIGEVAESWQVTNLPSWASFDSDTGELSGTPSQAATHSGIVITATNQGGSSDTGEFVIEVIAGVTAPSLSGTAPNGAVNSAYGFAVSNSGGTVATWGVTGTLPTGISFSNGVFTGTPTAAGVYSGISVTASNTAGADNLAVTIEILPGTQAPLNFVDPGPVSKTTADAPFINLAQGGSGTGALTYASSDASIASVDSASGEVTLVNAGTVTISASKAADADYLATSANYTLEVSQAISFGPLPPVTVFGVPYNWTPQVSGATIVSWRLVSGSLPEGITLDSETGTLSGTSFVQPATYEFVLGATTDANEELNAQFVLAVVIQACIPGSEGFCELTFQVNEFASVPFVAAFVVDPVWTLDGDLPAGMSFDGESGELSGTPTETGTYNVTVTGSNGIDQEFYFVAIQVNDFLVTKPQN